MLRGCSICTHNRSKVPGFSFSPRDSLQAMAAGSWWIKKPSFLATQVELHWGVCSILTPAVFSKGKLAHSGNLLDRLYSIGCLPLPASPPRACTSVSWDHLPNNLVILQSLSWDSWENPNGDMSLHIYIKTPPNLPFYICLFPSQKTAPLIPPFLKRRIRNCPYFSHFHPFS